jgi:hypothetical protein
MNDPTHSDFPQSCRYYRSTFYRALVAIAISCIPIIGLPLPASSYLGSNTLNQPVDTLKPIRVRDRSLIIDTQIQQEIAAQIPELDRQLEAQLQAFAIPISQRLDLVYIHQGRSDWQLKFTYGGYLLKTSDRTIYTSAEIWQLKEKLRAIETIEITGKNYATNSSIQQLGPILHGKTGC